MLTDNGSKVDPQPMVQDWIDSGFVEWSSEEEPSSQMKTYQRCLDAHRLTFSWIAFIDLDEMLVMRDPYASLQMLVCALCAAWSQSFCSPTTKHRSSAA